ncbi:glycosyl transferase [Nocardioides baekrokdamisoli]|uniref:Glycosyl transferase n=2 Tax=Nocardioides baekrokdamisoli TaxID=1804624 RepID=A0A3G9IQR0_9ACTN|nr:glycosyl transferase [Nocardioides baekrokdamisoli]
MLPLAIACREAGHEVAFATGHPFTDRLPVRTIALAVTQHDFDLANAEVSAQLKRGGAYEHTVATMMARAVGEPMRAALSPVIETYRPDAVVTEYLNVGARVAALEHGVRAYSFAITAPSRLNVAFAEYAADEHRDRLPATTTWRDLYEPLIDPTHPVLRRADEPVVDRLRIQPVPWSNDSFVPEWLLEPRTRPRVLVTLGTVFNRPDVLGSMAHGLGSLDADVLVVTGHGKGPIVGLPANIRQADFIAQDEALKHVDLAVHHGGSGTCAAAISLGLPQVILARGADQFGNAEALAHAGAAVALHGPIAPVDVFAAASRALDPGSGVITAAARLQTQWADMPSPAAVAARLR